MRIKLTTITALLGLIVSVAHAETDHFGKSATFPGQGEGATPPQTVFTPDTPKITLAVQLKDVEPGDKITATWIAEKTAGTPPNYKIDTSTLDVSADTGPVVAFRLSKPNAGWPAGSYKVDISYNGEVETSQRFTVAP